MIILFWIPFIRTFCIYTYIIVIYVIIYVDLNS
jgi:hypothetical protein